MKKFVIIDHAGTWCYDSKGRMNIDCTVKQYKFIEDSNDSGELWRKCSLNQEYHEDGTWHYLMVHKRSDAKYYLK